MGYILENIEQFLTTRSWNIERNGSVFTYYKPPEKLKLDIDYLLEIPNSENYSGFENYITNILPILDDIYNDEYRFDDLRILFTQSDMIIKLRLFDHDTKDGTISFSKFLESLEAFKKILVQNVTFAVTRKQIFGHAKIESEKYLEECRSLQTEVGSYISKFQIPNKILYNLIEEVNTFAINQNLLNVLEFVRVEIFQPKVVPEINENYLIKNEAYINFELLNSIKDFYQKPRLNNVEFRLLTSAIEKTVETNIVQPRLPYFK